MFIPSDNKFKVKDVMINIKNTPIAFENTIFKEVLKQMDKFKLGVVCIVGKKNKLKAIITDGDIRRTIINVQKPLAAILNDDAIIYATKNPVVIKNNSFLIDVIKLMGKYKIWDLPVIDNNSKLIGLLHLHPAIEKLLNHAHLVNR